MDLRRVFHKIIRLLAYTIKVLAMQYSLLELLPQIIIPNFNAVYDFNSF